MPTDLPYEPTLKPDSTPISETATDSQTTATITPTGTIDPGYWHDVEADHHEKPVISGAIFFGENNN